MPQPVWMTALPDAGLLGQREPQAAGPCPAGPSARASGCPHRTEWLSSLYVGGTDGALTSLPPPRVAWGRGPPGPPDAPSSPAAGRSVGAHRTLCTAPALTPRLTASWGRSRTEFCPLCTHGGPRLQAARGPQGPPRPRDWGTRLLSGPCLCAETSLRAMLGVHGGSVASLPPAPAWGQAAGGTAQAPTQSAVPGSHAGRTPVLPGPGGATAPGPAGETARGLFRPSARPRRPCVSPAPSHGGLHGRGGGCTGASNLFLHSLTLSLRRRERASVPGA